MGSSSSSGQLAGIDIEEKPVQITDHWTQYSATVNAENVSPLSVFIGPVEINDLSKSASSSLEKTAKNLMLYRHPCILKFIATWKKRGRAHLATERVVPLSQVLDSQTPLQVCIGLHSVLRALVFLHHKASVSHNNVCSESVFVAEDGAWKLGGLENLCRFSDLTPNYLEVQKTHRCEKNISPEEENIKSFLQYPTCIDQFAFGCLAEEVLINKTGDIPGMLEFQQLCRKQLKNAEPSIRPQLSSVLSLPFFTHSFIRIHGFLEELPLKSGKEKECFFRTVVDELQRLPEELVASQLGAMLLSRLVVLDSTAQSCLLPLLLCPKTESGEGLFSLDKYRTYVVPQLLRMFSVRDAPVRLVLLQHFSKFCHVFVKEQLKDLVLPELLVGIKDTDDALVSMTLRALADLVPLLGAARVIGGKRGKLFTDGRPKASERIATIPKVLKSPSRGEATTPQHSAATSSKLDTDSGASYETLPERPSPDGGEDHTTTDEDAEAWSDWENEAAEARDDGREQHGPAPGGRMAALADISTLDVKNSAVVCNSKEEIDFFQDMEPIISRTKVLQVVDASLRSKFEVTVMDEEEGWGDDLEDWGEVNNDKQDK